MSSARRPRATSSGRTCPSSPATTASAGGPSRCRSTRPTTPPAAQCGRAGWSSLSGDAGIGVRAGHVAVPAVPRGGGRSCLPGDLHHRPGPGAPSGGRRRRPRALPPAPGGPGLRHRRARVAVPHRGPGRVRRRGERVPCRAGRRRHLPHHRGEVVLLGGRRRPVLPHRPGRRRPPTAPGGWAASWSPASSTARRTGSPSAA